MSSGPRRAAALPSEERRAALIAATLPLLSTHGMDVSTRQIAAAAGVAEGTIFRAFSTKQELLDAVLADAFDPTALLQSLRDIDPATTLAERMTAAAELMQHRTRRIWHLLHVLRTTPASEDPVRGGTEAPWAAVEARIIAAVAALIAPDQDQLRCAPLTAARRLRLFALATSHPRLSGGEQLAADEVVAILLDGIRLRPEP